MNILTEQDFKDVDKVGKIFKEVEKSNTAELESIVDEIATYQPILISIFMGHNEQLKLEELDEVIRDFIVLWKYFSVHPKCKKARITEKLINEKDNKNIRFMQYLLGEPSKEERDLATAIDLANMKSKALMTGFLLKYNENNVLKNMNRQLWGGLVLGLKSLIECFEEITK